MTYVCAGYIGNSYVCVCLWAVFGGGGNQKFLGLLLDYYQKYAEDCFNEFSLDICYSQ